jgi:hypothetical protein
MRSARSARHAQASSQSEVQFGIHALSACRPLSARRSDDIRPTARRKRVRTSKETSCFAYVLTRRPPQTPRRPSPSREKSFHADKPMPSRCVYRAASLARYARYIRYAGRPARAEIAPANASAAAEHTSVRRPPAHTRLPPSLEARYNHRRRQDKR